MVNRKRLVSILHWVIHELYEFREANLYTVRMYFRGPGGSVGITTDYGLDGSGSNPGGDEIFRTSRPVLGPT